jgi:UDP-glucose/GDP-mannose dehydrogenase family, NAD binding domain
MKICMVGAGYVGLVSSACFAEFGWMRFWSTIRVPDVFSFLRFSQMLSRKLTLCFSLLERRCGAAMVTPI